MSRNARKPKPVELWAVRVVWNPTISRGPSVLAWITSEPFPTPLFNTKRAAAAFARKEWRGYHIRSARPIRVRIIPVPKGVRRARR